MQGQTNFLQYTPPLENPSTQVINAASPNLDILETSESWAGMFRDPRTTPSLQGQLGSEMFDDFSRWLQAFMACPTGTVGARPGARKFGKYRKLVGKDSSGLWFRATLVATVPERSEYASDGVVPVILSFEKKKVKRRPPSAANEASGCTTIFEEEDPDDSTSDATSTTQSSSRSSSHSSVGFQRRAPRVVKDSSDSWSMPTSPFLNRPAAGHAAPAGGKEASTGVPEPPRLRSRTLISL
mmetsp:Transcript_36229/g.91188  ORF Transcript_36229/g.91188 Transcript_36229/m.91188 type:complete len:240 (+) Transcript_36229:86-805(+)